MSRQINILIPTLIIMISLVQACGPSVTLSVEPSHVCRGETVAIRWTAPAPGDVSFTAHPSANVSFDMTSGLPSEGSMSATVEDEATITATASLPDEGRIANSVEVKVIFIGQSENIEAAGECRGATTPTWSAYVPPSEWSDRIRVRVVTNLTTRSITVTHDEVPADIPPGGSTDRLSGTKYAGAWTIESNLFIGTNPCGSPERGGPPLDPISINVELSCE